MRGTLAYLEERMQVPSLIRLAIRALIRRPGYAITVVAVLGLGIGANTAIFSLVDAVLLRSLPYAEPESVVVVFADASARGQGARLATTPGDFFDWRAQTGTVFAGLAALRNVSPRITSLDTPVVPLTHAVTANYFQILRARPLLGRAFRDGEDAAGHDDVVMLSFALWQSKFGGDPSIVGRTIDLDSRPHLVVGVMGPDFYSPHMFNVQPDLWIPTAFERERDDRSTRDILVYGRLHSGVTVESAGAAARTVAARIAREHPDTDDRWSITLVPIRQHVVGAFTRVATIVLSAVGVVLLIVCANVASLALARGVERSGEIAVRTALGAGRARIVAELVTETLVLSLLGAAAGTFVAWFAIPALVHLIPTSAGVPFLHRAVVDSRVLGFELAIAIACALLSAVLPARQAVRLDIVAGLRATGRGGASASANRWRRLLVIAEVALAVLVVASAALLTRSLLALDRVPAGFQSGRIAKLRTSLRGDTFAAAAARVAHFEELQRRLDGVPSVQSASGVSFEPPTPEGQVAAVRLRLPGQSESLAATPSAVSRVVLPDYFETMGIPILDGRAITRADRADAARVVVISQTMANRYFSGVEPVGRSFGLDAPGARSLRIVGICGDVLTAGIDPTPQPVFYVPYAQSPLPAMTMVMRVHDGDAATPLRDAERLAWSLSPFTNVYAIETMEDRLAQLNWRARFTVSVLGGFAIVGLLLAAAGLYAVVSYTVTQRRGEIGLRMALGASANAILVEVIGAGLRTVAAGLVVGNAAALVLTRALNGMLYGVAPGDPATLALVSVSMLGVALCACVVPARAAARLDPLTALRIQG
jgi:putative ABC transport system permease protein